MKDMQNEADHRQIDIDQVGVSDLRYPIVVLDRDNERQSTVATLAMSVNLPHQFKGTHMSRFLEVLGVHRTEMTMGTVPLLLHDLRERLQAQSARVEVNFPYFLERRAPVTKSPGFIDTDCWFHGEASDEGDDFLLGVKVPVTSLCPCSKAISDYGAHNQRGYLTIEVRTANNDEGDTQMVWIEEVVEVAERAASSPVYPLLKRPDERYVTMAAYDRPVFVEDMVRNVASELKGDPRVAWFHVHAVNHESIHSHNAFARIEWTRPS